MSLKYEPFSEPIHISAKWLFVNIQRHVAIDPAHRHDEVPPFPDTDSRNVYLRILVYLVIYDYG